MKVGSGTPYGRQCGAPLERGASGRYKVAHEPRRSTQPELIPVSVA